jgi:hypothetical protein
MMLPGDDARSARFTVAYTRSESTVDDAPPTGLAIGRWQKICSRPWVDIFSKCLGIIHNFFEFQWGSLPTGSKAREWDLALLYDSGVL